MIFDGISLSEGSVFQNPTIISGTSFPGSASAGELFYKSDTEALSIYTGTAWKEISSANLYDIALTIEGKPTADSVVFYFPVPRGFVIPSSFTGSLAKAAVASGDSAQFVVSKNGTQIGTITFSTSATGTFSGAGGSFAASDVLSIRAPVTQDSTLETVGITIVTVIS